MMSIYNQWQTEGERKRAVRETVEVEWIIPNFLSLSPGCDRSIASPPFKFLDKEWLLLIYPNGESGYSKSDCIGLYLKWLDDYKRSPLVDCSLFLKTASGREIKGSRFIQEIESIYGYYDFFTGSVLQKKSTLLPDGALTVLCSLKNCDPSIVLKTDKLSNDFLALLTDGTNSDVTARAGGEEFKLHKSVLCARTPYFAAMFKHDMSETATGIVTVNDCEADIFRLFVRYLYTGRVELSSDNVFHLFELANMYQVEDLKNDCLGYMDKKLTVDTFCDTVTFLQVHEDKYMLKRAKMFLSEYVLDIMKTKKWKKYLAENLDYANDLLLEALQMKEKSFEK